MADSKLAALTAETTPTTDDLLYLVNNPGGTPGDRKATVGDLASAMAAMSAFTGAFSPLPTALSSYTPTWSSTGTPPSLGNGTIVAGHYGMGKMRFVRINVIMGSSTTYGTGGWTFTLPAGVTSRTLPNIGQLLTVSCYDSSAGTIHAGTCLLGSAVTTVFPNAGSSGAAVTATAPFAWATGDYCTIQGWIEID